MGLSSFFFSDVSFLVNYYNLPLILRVMKKVNVECLDGE